MQHSILFALYNGELFPSEEIVSSDPNYRPFERAISAEREFLKKRLRDEDHERLENLGQMYRQASFMASYASFSYGFKLGALLMSEILQNDKETEIES